MDIDVIQRKMADLAAFKDRVQPMLEEWEAGKAKDRIGAKPVAPTEGRITRSAALILRHARNIERIVAPK